MRSWRAARSSRSANRCLERAVVGEPGEAVGRGHRLHLLVEEAVLERDRDLVRDHREHLAHVLAEPLLGAREQRQRADRLVGGEQRQHEQRLRLVDLDLARVDRRGDLARLAAGRQVVPVLDDHRREPGVVLELEIGQLLRDRRCPRRRRRTRTAAIWWRDLLLVVERDHRGVVLDDRGARIERGLHHLLERERAAEHRGRRVEPLVLVLRALDRAEHLLGLHDAQDLRAASASRSRSASVERRVAIGREHAAQVAALDQRHGDQRRAGAPALVVRQLAGLGRGAQQRLAIAHHRAEHAGDGEPRRSVMSSASDATSLSLTRSPSSSSHNSATVRAPSDRLTFASTHAAASPITRPRRRRADALPRRAAARRAAAARAPRRSTGSRARVVAAPRSRRGRFARRRRWRATSPRSSSACAAARPPGTRRAPPRATIASAIAGARDQRRPRRARRAQRGDRAGPRQHRHRERDHAVQQRIEPATPSPPVTRSRREARRSARAPARDRSDPAPPPARTTRAGRARTAARTASAADHGDQGRSDDAIASSRHRRPGAACTGRDRPRPPATTAHAQRRRRARRRPRAGARQRAYRHRRPFRLLDAQDDLARVDHAELVARAILDRADVGAQRVDLATQRARCACGARDSLA